MAESKFSVSDLLAFEIMRAHEEDSPQTMKSVDEKIWRDNHLLADESRDECFLRMARGRARLISQSATGISWARFVGGTGFAIFLIIVIISGILLFLTFNRGPLFQVDENNEMSTSWFLWMVSIQLIVLVSATLTFVGYWLNRGWRSLIGKHDGTNNQEDWFSKICSFPTRVIAVLLLSFIASFLWVANWAKINENFFLTLIRMFKSTLWPSRETPPVCFAWLQ